MKKRILMSMCIILTAALMYAMGGSEEAAAAKADKQLTIHMVFNGMVFDGNWDIYRLAAANPLACLTTPKGANPHQGKPGGVKAFGISFGC